MTFFFQEDQDWGIVAMAFTLKNDGHDKDDKKN